MQNRTETIFLETGRLIPVLHQFQEKLEHGLYCLTTAEYAEELKKTTPELKCVVSKEELHHVLAQLSDKEMEYSIFFLPYGKSKNDWMNESIADIVAALDTNKSIKCVLDSNQNPLQLSSAHYAQSVCRILGEESTCKDVGNASRYFIGNCKAAVVKDIGLGCTIYVHAETNSLALKACQENSVSAQQNRVTKEFLVLLNLEPYFFTQYIPKHFGTVMISKPTLLESLRYLPENIHALVERHAAEDFFNYVPQHINTFNANVFTQPEVFKKMPNHIQLVSIQNHANLAKCIPDRVLKVHLFFDEQEKLLSALTQLHQFVRVLLINSKKELKWDSKILKFLIELIKKTKIEKITLHGHEANEELTTAHNTMFANIISSRQISAQAASSSDSNSSRSSRLQPQKKRKEPPTSQNNEQKKQKTEDPNQIRSQSMYNLFVPIIQQVLGNDQLPQTIVVQEIPNPFLDDGSIHIDLSNAENSFSGTVYPSASSRKKR